MTDCIFREAAVVLFKGRDLRGDLDAAAILSIPAADVRPVVFCKDCEQADYSGMGDGTVWCMKMERAMQETDFCSRGKREES